MTFTFTEDNLKELLESPVSRFEEKRILCGRCDYYGSVHHAGLKCEKCGGDMVSVNTWLIGNLLIRVKPTPRMGEMWLSKFIADYLYETTEARWSVCYEWACRNYRDHIEMYRKIRA